jgi:hypothetical protein
MDKALWQDKRSQVFTRTEGPPSRGQPLAGARAQRGPVIARASRRLGDCRANHDEQTCCEWAIFLEDSSDEDK